MDISMIKAENVGDELGIHIGKKEAPVKVLEFVNFACPYCKQWFEKSEEILAEYVALGKVERIIKHFDKEKLTLRNGNVCHEHLDYSDPVGSLKIVAGLYADQANWNRLESEELLLYLEEKRGLTPKHNENIAAQIIAEAGRANINLVPTVIIGEHIFDEHITGEELRALIETELNK